jgi:hypothetical protein
MMFTSLELLERDLLGNISSGNCQYYRIYKPKVGGRRNMGENEMGRRKHSTVQSPVRKGKLGKCI